MTGRGDPPEGAPDGAPGGDDEYGRPFVFDESFVRAARIQEYSATERMRSDASAVRARRTRPGGGVSRQALALVLLIVLAFGTAVYMGIQHPYAEPQRVPRHELAVTLVPLVPHRDAEPVRGPVDEQLRRSPAAGYRVGAEGITLPPARRTEHYNVSQVLRASTEAKNFVVASSLNPDVVANGETDLVRQMVDPAQVGQFDRSVRRPRNDGRYAATGWMVRFDPQRVELADPRVWADGSIEVGEDGSGALQVVTDHTLVYALRPAGGPASAEAVRGSDPVLFTVRRELRMRFDREALRTSHVTLLESATEAGPQACSAEAAGFFQPLFDAGDGAGDGDPRGSGGTDPFDHDRPVAAACGELATNP